MADKRYSSFCVVTDAADAAAGMLADGEPLKRVWRFAVVQLFDDYLSVLEHEGVAVAHRRESP